MIIRESEVDALEVRLNKCWGDPDSMHGTEQDLCLNFLADNPHLLLPLGFVEARVWDRNSAKSGVLEGQFNIRSGFFGAIKQRVAYKNLQGSWFIVSEIGWPGWPGEPPEKLPLNGLPQIAFFGEKGQDDLRLLLDQTLSTVRSAVDSSLKIESIIVLPRMTSMIGMEEPEVVRAARGLIAGVQSETLRLADLSPFDLEDVVAELMRARGHLVQQTRRTRDGGRDLIVVGEFFPGVKTEMAVEITSSRVVGAHKVQRAMWQNREYPLVMVATSGRFSAGVLKLQTESDTRMRLHLADGTSLSEWISKYQ